MYLHNNIETFKSVIKEVSNALNIDVEFIEKDYYITMILKEFTQLKKDIVFKGGTSLSKCYGIINRFSEDIDISFSEHLGEAKRRNIKHNVIKSISEILNIPIINWKLTHSNRNVSKYLFLYNSIIDDDIDRMVSLETSFVLPAFPIINQNISSFVYQYYISKDIDFIKKYELDSFPISCQSIERTYIDKIFAICDYYLLNKSTRLSRHLYDLHKLYPIIKDLNLNNLFSQIRELRSKIDLCPSAKHNVNIKATIKKIIDTNYYKKDYENVTTKLIFDNVKYDETISTLKLIQYSLPL